MRARAWGLLGLLLVAACGGGERVSVGGIGLAHYTDSGVPQNCVPYAREVSGIAIRGDAWTWWDQADGVYARGDEPVPGAVLVLSRTGRLRSGHLAVVVERRGPREILVSHANWGADRETRQRVYQSQSVIDVSPGNDWSELRFWNVDAGSYGSVYEAEGFIYPSTYAS